MFLHFQLVPEKSKESPGAPWQFVGLLSLFDPPRHDSAETIRRALHLGVNVKMITGKLNGASASICNLQTTHVHNLTDPKFIFLFLCFR